MLRFISFLIFFSTGSGLLAQSDTTALSSDRPTQSASAFLVPKGTIQIESGFSYARLRLGYSLSQFVESEFFTYNTTQVRFGLSDNLELRFSQDVMSTRTAGGIYSFKSGTQLVPTTIGARVHLFDMNERGRPQTALLVNVGGPVFSEIESGTSLDFRFNMEHSLGENGSVGYNIGGVLRNEFTIFDSIATLIFGYKASCKVSFFAELYMTFPNFGDAFLQSDFGILYSVNPNFQLDIFAGTGISDFTPQTLFGFGLSLRIPGK